MNNKKNSYPEASEYERIMWMASFLELNPWPVLEIDQKDGLCYVNLASKNIFPDLSEKLAQ